jgi:biopolymer transport protein ExbD
MGAKLGQAIGGRARGGSDDLVEAHEINVTPFIDVMLVLLIIFMVAAPVAASGKAGVRHGEAGSIGCCR